MAISEIARDNAQIIFVALVVNQAIAGKVEWLSFTSRVVTATSLWILSVIILKKLNQTVLMNLLFAVYGALMFAGIAFIYYANKKSKK